MSRSRPAPRGRPARRDRRPFPLVPVVLAVVVLLGVVAVVASRGGGGGGNGSSAAAGETRPVHVTGTPLPTYSADGPDPAVGATIPSVTGQTFTGAPVRIDATDGRPKLVMFVAHWCPHCQREVPLLTSWLTEHGLPKNVDLVAVSTNVQPNGPNYPPSTWLHDAGWPVTTMADDAKSTTADAFGLGSFPYFVAVDGQGKVVQRAAGELPTEAFASLIAVAGGGQG